MSAHLFRAIRDYRARVASAHQLSIMGALASGGALVLSAEGMLSDAPYGAPGSYLATLLITVSVVIAGAMYVIGRRAEAILETETGYSSIDLLLDVEGGEA